MRILVLGLGNDLLADDAIGPLAVRELEPRLAGRAEVVASALHGLALLDVLLDYDGAVIVDAASTGRHPVGTVYEIAPAALAPVQAPSPHFTGLPEMLDIARRLDLHFPTHLRIVVVEVQDPYTIGGVMTPAVRAALPALCDRVVEAVGELEAEAAAGG
jgi:hydrogenase maturation protease